MKLIYKDMTTQQELYKYQLASKGAGSPKMIDGLRWTHFDNLAKCPLVTLVSEGDRLAAIYATLPIKAKLGERVSITRYVDR